MPEYVETMTGGATIASGAFITVWSPANLPNPYVYNMYDGADALSGSRDPVDWATFRAEIPYDLPDLREGQVCFLSGLWYPGHAVTWSGGKPYGRDAFPDPAEPEDDSLDWLTG